MKIVIINRTFNKRKGEFQKSKMSNYDKIVKLYELYEQKMYGVAFSVLHDSWQAEDAVSEAFVKLIKNIRKIKDVMWNRSRPSNM